MSKPLLSIKRDQPIKEVVRIMDEKNIGVLPVVENHKAVGIITERDIIRKVVSKGLDISNTEVDAIMTKNPVCVKHTASLLELTKLMSENNFRRLLVTKDGKLVGLITAKDIIAMMSA
ncbi:MAG: CBS domain-containing protein [Nanoarchaeota archaeon]|nr:CBS domain-containing protein [Nanoarchaeota archaeon]